ncbi:MAG: DUF3999 family protein [bacterium]
MASLFLSTVCHAANFQTEFMWRMPLRDSVVSGRLYRIKTPPELFDGSMAFPSDLRIIDARTNQWPYFLWVPAPVEEVAPVQFELLNRSMVDGPNRHLRQDFRIVPGDARRAQGRPRHDRISLNTAGSEFIRRVEVYGSENQSDWARLAAGYLVDQQTEMRVVSRTVVYPVSDFPFLQVRIYPNARDATEEIELRAVSVASTQRKPGELEDVKMAMADAPAEELDDGVQGIVLDQGAKNRPVSRLRVEVGTREFIRAVRVEGRNQETNSWRWIADDSIHRIDDQEQLAMDVKDAPYRYFRLQVFNRDDVPIAIDSVVGECVPRYLVFEVRGAGEAFVYSGSSSLGPPQYDLQRRTNLKELPLMREIRLGSPELNPNRRPPGGFGSWGRVLALITIGAVSALVIWVIVSMVRRETPAT